MRCSPSDRTGDPPPVGGNVDRDDGDENDANPGMKTVIWPFPGHELGDKADQETSVEDDSRCTLTKYVHVDRSP